MQRWTIGDVTITRVIEVEGPVPASFLLRDATPERLAAHAGIFGTHFPTPTAGHIVRDGPAWRFAAA